MMNYVKGEELKTSDENMDKGLNETCVNSEQVLIDADLLKQLIENTELLIAEYEYMKDSQKGEAVLASLEKEVREAKKLLD